MTAEATTPPDSSIPADDPARKLRQVRADDPEMPHIGLVGDTYTVLLDSIDTAGRFCLVDMHIPPSGGPPPHRHDFEESFIVLEGEIQAHFRGQRTVVKAGETLHIPANAPHQFQNRTDQAARLLCICSPAGQEEFFATVGVLVATRTTAPPPLDESAQARFRSLAEALAPQYKTEFVRPS
jgi:quercetin dioxygenase-like cupin family protein